MVVNPESTPFGLESGSEDAYLDCRATWDLKKKKKVKTSEWLPEPPNDPILPRQYDLPLPDPLGNFSYTVPLDDRKGSSSKSSDWMSRRASKVVPTPESGPEWDVVSEVRVAYEPRGKTAAPRSSKDFLDVWDSLSVEPRADTPPPRRQKPRYVDFAVRDLMNQVEYFSIKRSYTLSDLADAFGDRTGMDARELRFKFPDGCIYGTESDDLTLDDLGIEDDESVVAMPDCLRF